MPNLRKLCPNQAACPAAGTQSLTPWDILDHISRSLPKSNAMKSYKSLQVSVWKHKQYIYIYTYIIAVYQIYATIYNQKFLKLNSSASFQGTQLDSADDPPESTLSRVAACVALVSCWVGASSVACFGNRFLSHVYQQQLFLCPFSPFADVRIDISQFNWICGLLRYLNPSSIKSTAKAMLVVPATNFDILLLFATRIWCYNLCESNWKSRSSSGVYKQPRTENCIDESWKCGSSGRGCFSHLAPQATCRWRFCWWWKWGLGELSLGYDWSLRLPQGWVFGRWCG